EPYRVADENGPDEPQVIDAIEGDDAVVNKWCDHTFGQTECKHEYELPVGHAASKRRRPCIYLVHMNRIDVAGEAGEIDHIRLGHCASMGLQHVAELEVIEVFRCQSVTPYGESKSPRD